MSSEVIHCTRACCLPSIQQTGKTCGIRTGAREEEWGEQKCLCLEEDIKRQKYSKQEVIGRYCMHVTKEGFRQISAEMQRILTGFMKHSDNSLPWKWKKAACSDMTILLLCTGGMKAKCKGTAYLNGTTQEQQQKPLHLLHALACDITCYHHSSV